MESQIEESPELLPVEKKTITKKQIDEKTHKGRMIGSGIIQPQAHVTGIGYTETCDSIPAAGVEAGPLHPCVLRMQVENEAHSRYTKRKSFHKTSFRVKW